MSGILQKLKKYKFKLLTFIAIINTLLIGFISFMTVIAFRTSTDELMHFTIEIIFICILGSLITKFKSSNKISLGISAFFDLILIIYLYDPIYEESILNFIFSRLTIDSFIMILFYLYLIVFYIIGFKQKKIQTLKETINSKV